MNTRTASTDASTDASADRALKTKHRGMWASGDYPAVAHEVIPRLGEVLVDAAVVRTGDRVLDVAAGSGNAAIPAAARGADVVASDLTPELFTAGQHLAVERGVQLAWEEGDAENLPYDDGIFDTVLSCVGVMFAPHHQAAADELLRVLRPGGTVGVLSWTPEGFIGRMFATMKPFAPAPPPGAQPPPLWGDVDHVTGLFGDRVVDLQAAKRTLRVDRFGSPEEFRDFFKRTYGPTIATYRHLGDDAARVSALDRALAELAADHGRTEGGAFVMDWEYVVVTARRRAGSRAVRAVRTAGT